MSTQSTHLRIDSQCSRVRVVDGIAFLVVTRILLDASSSVEATYWLSDVHEALVVGSSREPCCGDIYAVLREVLNEKFFDGS